MPTVKFLLMVNDLFDILNSRNTIAMGHKAPISARNKEEATAKLQDGIQVLMSLTTATGTSIRSSKRWLSVMGIVITALSLTRLLPELLTRQRFVLTYKFSQDHLELLFGSVRRLGGWSNSPTALQFAKIWRQLIRRTGVKTGTKGNAITLDPTCIVSVGHVTSETVMSIDRTPIPDDESLLLLLHDMSETTTLTPLIRNAVCYIAGWVVRKAAQIITCETCAAALTTTSPPADLSDSYCLIEKKDYTGRSLRMPSKPVLSIALTTERAIRATEGYRTSSALETRICSTVVGTVGTNDGFELGSHDRETLYGIDTHSSVLIRTIASLYYRVRQHHAARLHTQRLQAGNRRKTSNKLTLFRGH